MPGSMRLTFLVSLVGMTCLFVTLWKLELTSKNASEQMKRLRARLETPPPDEARAEAPPAPVGVS